MIKETKTTKMFARSALLAAGCLLAGQAQALIVVGPNGPLTVTNDIGTVTVAPSSPSLTMSGGTNVLSPFQINLNYVAGAPGGATQAAFESAKATWESRIIGWQEDAGLTGVSIDVTLAPNDGVGGILGSAGPSTASITTNYAYAASGQMTFDTADIPGLGSAFEDVVLHEMAHVLGIGTLWNTASFGGVFAGTQSLYTDGTGQYTGANGLAAWQSEFAGQGSATFVPVELGGGAGTADGHWNEGDGGGATGILEVDAPNRDSRLMLMTGWLNNGSFISDTTMGSFEDLGYTIVPEPGSVALLVGGLILFGIRRRR